jgi:hypothetical protein
LRRLLETEQRNLWKIDAVRAAGYVGSFDSRYLPESGVVFPVPYVRVRRERLYVYGGFASQGADGRDGEVVFPIHPAQLRDYARMLDGARTDSVRDAGPRLIGTPTSSVRTILAWPEEQPERAAFVKLSLRSAVLGDRRLSGRKVASSIGRSQFVLGCQSELPAGLQYFPETLGLVPRQMSDSGVIFRAIPEELMNGSVLLAPLFSLMGGSTNHPPLVLRLLESGDSSIREFIEEILLSKFAKIWVDLVFDHGLILEAHAQDLLLAFSPELVPLGSFYYRDFEGLTVDWALRRARGLPEPRSLPYAFDWFLAYETWGYPRYQMVSTKMRVSLTGYVDLVLGELESALLEWQARGIVRGEKFEQGELTRLFSRYLRKWIQEKFGLRDESDYDIRHQRSRFIRFLMQVRMKVMSAYA